MVLCLLAGIVLWYTFRVAIFGRWRDVIRCFGPVVFVFSCVSSPGVFAQDSSNVTGAPLISFNSAAPYVDSDVGGSPQFAYYGRTETVGGDDPSTLWDDSVFSPYHSNEAMVYDGEFWGVAGWLDDEHGRGPLAYTVRVKLDSPHLRMIATVGIHSAELLFTNDGLYFLPGDLFALWDSNGNMAHGLLRRIYVTGSLAWPVGGGGGDGDGAFVRPVVEDPDELGIEFVEGIGLIRDGEEQGSLLDTDSLLAVFDDSSVISYTTLGDSNLPFPVPVLVSGGQLWPHVDRVMTEILGNVWQSPPAGSTAEKLFYMLQVSGFASIVESFENAADYARYTWAPDLFDGVRRVGTFVMILWFVNYCWNVITAGLGLRVRNIFAASSDGFDEIEKYDKQKDKDN